MAPKQVGNKTFVLRTVVDVALALHFTAAAAYWWLSPKGFPVESGRFWLNSVLPIVLIAVAFAGLIGMHRKRWSFAAIAVLFFASAWCAGAISGRILFPSSLRGIWVIALIIAAAGIICFAGLIRGERRRFGLWLFASTASSLIGLFAMWAQIPLAASTRPIEQLPQIAAQQDHLPTEAMGRQRVGGEFEPARAKFTFTTGNIRIECYPILEFDRISPDRFWSLFAPSKKEQRFPTKQTSDAIANTIRYSDGSILLLAASKTEGTQRLSAFTQVQQDTFTHLNSYCQFHISGHKRLSLSFSPCPDDEIDVLPTDYPTGRPARLAYLDVANNFCIVEARSGEKGPFRPLAIGKLARGEALTVIIRDNSDPIAAIRLEDWSTQVSTDLSPSAGWSLPMNAIEFQRLDDATDAPVSIWITLAATSVGRGWETVGHRSGIYRNNIEFQADSRP